VQLEDTQEAGIIHVVKDQLSYINASVKVGNRNSIKIGQLASIISVLNKNVAALQTQFNENITTSFTSSVSTVLSITAELRQFRHLLNVIQTDITQLEDALHFIRQGSLPLYFLDPAKFMELLKVIEKSLPGELSLIARLDLSHTHLFYNTAQVRALTIGSGIRLYITIPVTANNRVFQLFSTHEMPVMVHNNSMAVYVKTEFQYFAVTPDHQYFIELTSSDLDLCQGDLLRVCPTIKPLQKSNSASCLYALFSGNKESAAKLCDQVVILHPHDTFRRSINSNTWFFYVKQVKLLMQCASQTGTYETSNVILKGSGMITINPSCTAHSNDYILLPHSTFQSNRTMHIEFKIPQIHNMFHDHDTDHQQAQAVAVEKLLGDIRNSNEGPLVMPLKEWTERLTALSDDKWYSRSSVHVSSGMSLICIVVLAVVIYKFRTQLCTCIKTKINLGAKPDTDTPLPIVEEGNSLLLSVPEAAQNPKIYPSGII
jgi:Baculovirus F protein